MAFFSSAPTHLSLLLLSFSSHAVFNLLLAKFFGFFFGKNGGINGSNGGLAALRSGVEVEVLLLLFVVLIGDFGAQGDAPFMNDSN